MMSAFTDEFADALDEITMDDDLVPASMAWPSGSDPSYRGLMSGAAKGGKLEEMGYAVDLAGIFVVRGSLFGDTKPSRGHTCTINGIDYGIDRVLTAPGSAFLKLMLVNKSRGA